MPRNIAHPNLNVRSRGASHLPGSDIFDGLYTRRGIDYRCRQHGAYTWFLRPIPKAQQEFFGTFDTHTFFKDCLHLAREVGLLTKDRRRRLKSTYFDEFFQVAMELTAAGALARRFGFRIEPEPESGSSIGEFDILTRDGRRVFCEVKSPFHPESTAPSGGFLLANERAVKRIRRTVQRARSQLPTQRPSLVVFCGILQDRPLSTPFLTIDAFDALYKAGGEFSKGNKFRTPSGVLFIDATRSPISNMALALNPRASHSLFRADFSGIPQCANARVAGASLDRLHRNQQWPVYRSRPSRRTR